ncbi:OLC1v1013754C1 [Oldenlandia corymbosa var. corymbosa]|uniref:OLC1v1013754C1 n=1 Tax=Oldenlandia corymbosa var. corymbosa TaxID=529605 RepID=A0AAV1E2H2_OLDCO|nr:OLC1v1013754C1 [Oldenlandia corymbosa var. corymbosa]
MAISTAFGYSSCRPYYFFVRSPLRSCLQNVRVSCSAAIEAVVDEADNGKNVKGNTGGDGGKAIRSKKLNSSKLGITNSMIPRTARVVLNNLKRKGFEVYLVGGCVRDLILKRTPKDFDIITSAELREVKRIFSRCEIVGKRFPICHVHIDDSIVEVSSFNTYGRNSGKYLNLASEKHVFCDEADYTRWRNCLQRDFTINGLMFDPYAKLIYDYVGAMDDIRKAKVRTIVPAEISLTEDCARILRAIRVAARLQFKFSKETALSIKNLASSVFRLDRGRLLMEMNYMLAYGSAEASLRLLWRFGLLEIILPIQAAYFVHIGFRRNDKRSNMLLSLFFNLDKYVAPDSPCHSSLWVALLGFHRAIFDQPSDPLVVATLCLAVHNGGDLLEASNIAKKISREHDISFIELSESQDLDSDSLIAEAKFLAASIQDALSNMTDEYAVSRAMTKYPKAPYSDLVLISLALYLRVCKIFDCVKGGREKGFVPKRGSKIKHEELALGALHEVRHVFARVVFDTIFPIHLKNR